MQVKWGQSHEDVERKVPIAILEWSSLINPESIEPFLPKAPLSTEQIIPALLTYNLKDIMFLYFFE